MQPTEEEIAARIAAGNHNEAALAEDRRRFAALEAGQERRRLAGEDDRKMVPVVTPAPTAKASSADDTFEKKEPLEKKVPLGGKMNYSEFDALWEKKVAAENAGVAERNEQRAEINRGIDARNEAKITAATTPAPTPKPTLKKNPDLSPAPAATKEPDGARKATSMTRKEQAAKLVEVEQRVTSLLAEQRAKAAYADPELEARRQVVIKQYEQTLKEVGQLKTEASVSNKAHQEALKGLAAETTERITALEATPTHEDPNLEQESQALIERLKGDLVEIKQQLEHFDELAISNVEEQSLAHIEKNTDVSVDAAEVLTAVDESVEEIVLDTIGAEEIIAEDLIAAEISQDELIAAEDKSVSVVDAQVDAVVDATVNTVEETVTDTLKNPLSHAPTPQPSSACVKNEKEKHVELESDAKKLEQADLKKEAEKALSAAPSIVPTPPH